MPSYAKRRPRPGEPIFLLYRHGRLVELGNGSPKVFYSVEHFEALKKAHPTRYLDTDVLVKYVPAKEDV